MDQESSTKFIGSLTKFLQSLCNGYVEFEDGVELIGHIYLSVDAGKTSKKLNYFLNEKVCKNDNSVTFISNSFHAQPESKAKGPSSKENEGNKEDEGLDSGDNVPKSTNSGTVPSRPQLPSRSAPSPNQSRSGVQIGGKRPGSPLSAPTAPSQRRIHVQQPAVRSSVGSPTSKTVPSSPSSSSQDNIPSPSPARKNRNESSQPPSNQSDNASFENENDIPSNIMSINPPPDFASFLGSLTSDNQTSREQHSPPDMKPDTDVTFIKEEFVSEPSCAQTGNSGQSGRSGDDLYPVMLHQNTSVFPTTSSGYPSTATSQHPGFPGTSTSQADPFSQDGADPSVTFLHRMALNLYGIGTERKMSGDWNREEISAPSAILPIGVGAASGAYCKRCMFYCPDMNRLTKHMETCQQEEASDSGSCVADTESSKEKAEKEDAPVDPLRPYRCTKCGRTYQLAQSLQRHRWKCDQSRPMPCTVCGIVYYRADNLQNHLKSAHNMFLNSSHHTMPSSFLGPE